VIYQLEKRAFRLIEPLVNSGIRFPEILSVARGNNPGWVFVDDSRSPSSALVWSKGIEGFYLVGNEHNTGFLRELNAYIDEAISPRMQKRGLEWFEVCGNRSAWDPVIEAAFIERKLSRSFQCIYTLGAPRFRSNLQSADVDCEVRKVDRSLLGESHLRNREFVLSKIKRFWDSEETFLDRGLGFAVVWRKEVTSLCFSAFVADFTHAIDVETLDEYRRRGFAEVAAREFVKLCRQRELRPHWECMQANVASVALAEKLGFQKSTEYKLYSFRLKKPRAR
jgi:GNAT superfamily N-acetyltransferase